MDVGTLVEDDELLIDELLEVDEVVLLEDGMLEVELINELDELVIVVKDEVVLSLLITLVVDVDVDSTIDVVDSSLDEITGSVDKLEVTLLTGPEQAEINKAHKSDKCFFMIKQPYT